MNLRNFLFIQSVLVKNLLFESKNINPIVLDEFLKLVNQNPSKFLVYVKHLKLIKNQMVSNFKLNAIIFSVIKNKYTTK